MAEARKKHQKRRKIQELQALEDSRYAALSSGQKCDAMISVASANQGVKIASNKARIQRLEDNDKLSKSQKRKLRRLKVHFLEAPASALLKRTPPARNGPLARLIRQEPMLFVPVPARWFNPHKPDTAYSQPATYAAALTSQEVKSGWVDLRTGELVGVKTAEPVVIRTVVPDYLNLRTGKLVNAKGKDRPVSVTIDTSNDIMEGSFNPYGNGQTNFDWSFANFLPMTESDMNWSFPEYLPREYASPSEATRMNAISMSMTLEGGVFVLAPACSGKSRLVASFKHHDKLRIIDADKLYQFEEGWHINDYKGTQIRWMKAIESAVATGAIVFGAIDISVVKPRCRTVVWVPHDDVLAKHHEARMISQPWRLYPGVLDVVRSARVYRAFAVDEEITSTFTEEFDLSFVVTAQKMRFATRVPIYDPPRMFAIDSIPEFVPHFVEEPLFFEGSYNPYGNGQTSVKISKKACDYHKKPGGCKKGNDCKFFHDPNFVPIPVKARRGGRVKTTKAAGVNMQLVKDVQEMQGKIDAAAAAVQERDDLLLECERLRGIIRSDDSVDFDAWFEGQGNSSVPADLENELSFNDESESVDPPVPEKAGPSSEAVLANFDSDVCDAMVRNIEAKDRLDGVTNSFLRDVSIFGEKLPLPEQDYWPVLCPGTKELAPIFGAVFNRFVQNKTETMSFVLDSPVSGTPDNCGPTQTSHGSERVKHTKYGPDLFCGPAVVIQGPCRKPVYFAPDATVYPVMFWPIEEYPRKLWSTLPQFDCFMRTDSFIAAALDWAGCWDPFEHVASVTFGVIPYAVSTSEDTRPVHDRLDRCMDNLIVRCQPTIKVILHDSSYVYLPHEHGEMIEEHWFFPLSDDLTQNFYYQRFPSILCKARQECKSIVSFLDESVTYRYYYRPVSISLFMMRQLMSRRQLIVPTMSTKLAAERLIRAYGEESHSNSFLANFMVECGKQVVRDTCSALLGFVCHDGHTPMADF
jgi:hypothetical protein